MRIIIASALLTLYGYVALVEWLFAVPLGH